MTADEIQVALEEAVGLPEQALRDAVEQNCCRAVA
jgi:hypothetical protein